MQTVLLHKIKQITMALLLEEDYEKSNVFKEIA